MENMDNILDSVDNPMTVSCMKREKESVMSDRLSYCIKGSEMVVGSRSAMAMSFGLL